MEKGVLWGEERIGHIERMENDRFGKRVYVGECSGHSVCRPRKGWIDTLKEFKKKKFGCSAYKENGG